MLTPMLPYLTGILQMTPEPAWIFAVSLAPCKAEAQFGQLPSPRAARTVVGGSMPAEFLAGINEDRSNRSLLMADDVLQISGSSLDCQDK